MITVAGEALIDIVIAASGSITALPGGAPFNVARTIAQLGGTCQFLGKLSDDTFGEQLQASLQRDGVKIAVANVTPAPTTLAIARLDEFGTAEYRFYLDGTSAAQLSAADVLGEILCRRHVGAAGARAVQARVGDHVVALLADVHTADDRLQAGAFGERVQDHSQLLAEPMMLIAGRGVHVVHPVALLIPAILPQPAAPLEQRLELGR